MLFVQYWVDLDLFYGMVKFGRLNLCLESKNNGSLTLRYQNENLSETGGLIETSFRKEGIWKKEMIFYSMNLAI